MSLIITTPKARKDYLCCKCGAVIRRGHVYRRIATPENGRLITSTECLVCKREMPVKALRVPSVVPKIDLMPRSCYDLDSGIVEKMMIKMYSLGQLAWDYAHTVLDIASRIKIADTKPLSRAVRALHAEYDRFITTRLSMFDKQSLTQIGELFESSNSECFARLCNGLKAEIGPLHLNEDYRSLVFAVQMAMTLIDAMKLYDRHCAKWMTEQRLPTESVLANHFNRLAVMLPEFASHAYDAKSQARMVTSKILYKNLVQI